MEFLKSKLSQKCSDEMPEKGGDQQQQAKNEEFDSACGLGTVDLEVEVNAPKASTKSIDPGVSFVAESDTDRSMEWATPEPVSDRSLRLWRKRPGRGVSCSEPDSEDSTGTLTPKAKTSKSNRGRGRPPTTGKYVGLAKAKEAVNAAKREEFLKDFSDETTEAVDKVRRTRATHPSKIENLLTGKISDQLTWTLKSQVLECAEIIKSVSRKSGHLSGPFQKALNETSQFIVEATEVLSRRSVSEETKKLQAENATLRAELGALRNEFAEFRAELSQGRPAADTTLGLQKSDLEEFTRQIMIQVGTMVNARLEALEDRLLPQERMRPSLAADRAQTASQAVSVATKPNCPSSPAPASSSTSGIPSHPVSKPSKKAKKKSMAAQEAAAAHVACQLPAAPPKLDETWSTVAKKGSKPTPQRANKKGVGAPAPEITSKRRKRIRVPRSAAVTITLLPGAVEKGFSYDTVIREAQTRIDVESLGIDEIRYRRGVTGARIWQIHGPSGEEKADKLVGELRKVLSSEFVKVHHPVKRVDLRIIGLDDAVTAEEVASAVASKGGCDVDAIKTSVMGANGTIHVSCPAEAAKRVAASDRIKVGSWVSAKVVLLDPRPLRCFRCLETGHMGCKCSAEVDRSDCCFRCGKTGHQARYCAADPYCAICAAADRPSTHSIGSKGCPDVKAQQGQHKKSRQGRNRRGKAMEGSQAPQQSQRPAEEHLIKTVS